jgi:hypothetical protein
MVGWAPKSRLAANYLRRREREGERERKKVLRGGRNEIGDGGREKRAILNTVRK